MATKPVVAGADGSPESVRAVQWAAREAKLRGTSLRIVAIAAMPPRMSPNPATHGTVAGHIEAAATEALSAAASQAAAAAPEVAVETKLIEHAAPATALVECGQDAMMLVLGSRGAGAFTALVLGSISRYAAGHAACPVVVIRDETTPAHGLVGVGVGDLEHSAAALTFAFEEASARKASLVAIHAWHRPQTDISRAGEAVAPPSKETVRTDAARHLAGLLDEWKAKYPDVAVSQEVVHGHPGRALVGLSARADLVVLGRHTRHPGMQGPGSARHAVLNHAHGPIAVVPS
jgi:nucleotide-binding universal stress UspA family protein